MVKKTIISIILFSIVLFCAGLSSTVQAAEPDKSSALSEAGEAYFMISSSRIYLGENIVIDFIGSENKQVDSVNYYVRSSKNAEWRKISVKENPNSVIYCPQKTGYYQFKAIAVFNKRSKIIRLFNVTVQKDTGAPLALDFRLPADSIELGRSIMLRTALSGGVSPYRYSFSYYFNKKWTTIIKNSNSSYVRFTPPQEGYYTLAFYGRDSSGKLVSKRTKLTVTRKTGSPFTNTTESVSSAMLGLTLKIQASAAGGTAPYMFEALITDPETGEQKIIRTLDPDNEISFHPKKAGYYNITVNAVDFKGRKTASVLPVVFFNSTGKKLTASAEKRPFRLNAGTKAEFNTSASGGVLPYKYQTFIRALGQDWKNVDENDENSSCIAVFDKPGYYQVKTVVTDYTGTRTETNGSLTVIKNTGLTLENKSFIIKNLISAGDELTVNAAATGGSAPYTYQYYYRRVETNNWTWINRDPKSDICTCRINTTGLFEFRVVCTDQENKRSEKIIRYNVVRDTGKPLMSVSTVSSGLLITGDTIVLSAKASGGSEPYSYWYSVAYEDDGMTYIGSSRYSTSHSYKIPRPGKYTFRITVQDGAGKTITKDTVVYAATGEKHNLIRSCDLMEAPMWASKCVDRAVEGGQVQIIKQSGCWYMIIYGKNVGWIYDLALGSYTNYSEISSSTINAVADDLIFYNGRSIKEIYEYVKELGYTHIEDFGEEENSVYIMKYRRGACYQRASLLCLLLNRAGYETVRITDGRTKRGPHNWCIVKTDEGYRHIDPTSVLEIGKTFLATDSYMEKYVFWDREKYPACV